MVAFGDDIICVSTDGDGALYEFRYYLYTYKALYGAGANWCIDVLGRFGKEWYYSDGMFWFKVEDDLTAFTLVFG